MLTLADQIDVGPFRVFRDVVWRGGRREYTSTFYVVPAAPRLCGDGSGPPVVHPLWYRGALDGEAPLVGGALLSLTVDLSLAPEARDALVRDLAAFLPPGAGPVNLRPLPVTRTPCRWPSGARWAAATSCAGCWATAPRGCPARSARPSWRSSRPPGRRSSTGPAEQRRGARPRRREAHPAQDAAREAQA